MTNQLLHKKITIAALISGCFFMSACENDVNDVRELGRKGVNTEEGRQINSYFSNNGKVRAHLTAPLLLRHMTDTGLVAEFPNTLHVDFFNDSTKQESQLSAQYARYLENGGKVFLKDKVVAFNVKGDTLYCKEMYWDQNKQQFYTDKEVTISQANPRRLFNGIGMQCNQDLSNLTIFRIQPGSFATIPDSTANTGSKQ
jgi:LPS export ABC transporter protein LptC